MESDSSRPTRSGNVEFHIARSEDEELLAEVFADMDTTYFRPHPFTPDEARRLASYPGRDVYAILAVDGRPVAYGLLRGWDEGYATPSLGVAVRRSAQRRGYGRLMIESLHAVARARGASRVRLRVHRDNAVARHLYESLGYRYDGEERGELVMVVDVG
jgi:GNAT superfamily N-acetyltransferase